MRENLAISKRHHVLSHSSTISWPIWLKFHMVIPDIIFLALVSQLVKFGLEREILYVEHRNFEKF